MKDLLEVKIEVCLNENGSEMLQKKISSYNLGTEFNYAVVVLDLSITDNKKHSTNTNVCVELSPKVRYIAPFVTRELAELYCVELSSVDQLKMLLDVRNGRAIFEDVETQDIVNISLQ